MIACIDEDRGLGKDNELIYHTKEDMAYFKQATTGGIVIMGRNTYTSIPEKYRPLPNRINYVLSHNPPEIVEPRLAEQAIPDLYIRNDLGTIIREAKALAVLKGLPQIFIIGGAELYYMAMSHADMLILTEVAAVSEADVFFPLYPDNVWIETGRSEMIETINTHTDQPVKIQYATYERRIP